MENHFGEFEFKNGERSTYLRLLGKRLDMDLYIYYLRKLLFDHIQNFEHIRVYIQCMDLQSILVNKRKNQHRFVLYKWHLLHKANLHMGSVEHLDLSVALKNQSIFLYFLSELDFKIISMNVYMKNNPEYIWYETRLFGECKLEK